MRVGSCVFLIDLFQFFVIEDVIVGVFPCLLLVAVQLQGFLLLGRLLFVRSTDGNVPLLDAFLLPLHGLEFLLGNVGDFLVLGHILVDLAQILNIFLRFSPHLLFGLLVHVKLHLLAQHF